MEFATIGTIGGVVLGFVTLMWVQMERLRGSLENQIRYLGEQIGQVRSELGGEIGQVRSEVSGEIGQVRSELGGEIGQLRSELGGEIGQLRSELGGEIGQLRSEFAEFRTEVTEQFGEVRAVQERHTQQLIDITRTLSVQETRIGRLEGFQMERAAAAS